MIQTAEKIACIVSLYVDGGIRHVGSVRPEDVMLGQRDQKTSRWVSETGRGKIQRISLPKLCLNWVKGVIDIVSICEQSYR